MLAPTTLNDAWQEFVDGHGTEFPVRTKDDLGFLIMVTNGLVYDGDREPWDKFFEAVFATNWAFDSDVLFVDVCNYYNFLNM